MTTSDNTLTAIAIVISSPAIFSMIYLAIAALFNYILTRKPKPTEIMTPNQKNELDSLIAQTKGKFFSITFVKKGGAVRIINGKDKYNRLLNGGTDTVCAAGYVPFVNRNTEQWASAHKDAVITFKCGTLVKEVAP